MLKWLKFPLVLVVKKDYITMKLKIHLLAKDTQNEGQQQQKTFVGKFLFCKPKKRPAPAASIVIVNGQWQRPSRTDAATIIFVSLCWSSTFSLNNQTRSTEHYAQKLLKFEVKAWLYWNLIILPPLQFYVKSNFGEFKRSKNVIFSIIETELWLFL